jgi:hypothetical protein
VIVNRKDYQHYCFEDGECGDNIKDDRILDMLIILIQFRFLFIYMLTQQPIGQLLSKQERRKKQNTKTNKAACII